MRIIRVYVSTSKVGSRCETEIEVDDEATEEDITELAQEAMFGMIEWDWREKDT